MDWTNIVYEMGVRSYAEDSHLNLDKRIHGGWEDSLKRSPFGYIELHTDLKPNARIEPLLPDSLDGFMIERDAMLDLEYIDYSLFNAKKDYEGLVKRYGHLDFTEFWKHVLL